MILSLRCIYLSAIAVACSLAGNSDAFAESSEPSHSAEAAQITVTPVGPTQANLDDLVVSLPKLRAVAKLLDGTRYRFISTEVISADSVSARSLSSSRFVSTFYDYTNQRALRVEGSFAKPAKAAVRVLEGFQPNPNQAEFDEAISILFADPKLGAGLAGGDLATYAPLPPVLERDPASGNPMKRRIIHVGLAVKSGVAQYRNEIVGVDLASQEVRHYPGDAPPRAQGGSPNCGAPPAGQSTSSQYTAGQYQMTVKNGAGQTIWEMLVVRPSASSGTRASAIEVRNVKYKGRTVLKRGHEPILNVQYADNVCGPYRDWQYQEGQFATTTSGIDVAPGIRDCGTTPATTALETGDDMGNFKGVAIYRQGSEVVLVTELEAGWYRYISEWRFGMNGTIRPRFGFGATIDACTCFTHTHHVYFRLDLDIDGPMNRVYESRFGAAPNYKGTNKGLVMTERKMNRTGKPFFYHIRGGTLSYCLSSGSNDQPADTFGRGDLWMLRYHADASGNPLEIDDGFNGTTGNGVEANLDPFVNGESLVDKDIVLYYHASAPPHTPTEGRPAGCPTGNSRNEPGTISGPEVVGPDLIPE